jgi:hypothetical protein
MPLARLWPRLSVAGLSVLTVVLLWQVARGFSGLSGPEPTPTLGATPSGSELAMSSATFPPTQTPPVLASGADPTTAPSVSLPSATGRGTPTPAPTDRPWQADPVLVQAKIEGRVAIDSNGAAVILGQAPPAPSYPAAKSLDTSWSGLIQEPPRTGKDDRGVAYTDYNYTLLCGPGAGAVVLYYWPATRGAVTTKSGTFTEPVNLGANRYASTYWGAQGSGGYARGMIMWLAEVEWPTPDQGVSWWSRPGVVRWTENPPSTYVENLVDAINWEASGRSRLNYFYVIVRASELTAAALRDHVHADINMGVPVVIAARTSDGTDALPYWSVKSTRSAVNHFVTVVGYDDTAGTYAVMDTCGTTCNDGSVRAGVRNMSQAALFALIQAESDNDGIMW